ncbi:MAG: asparagine synthetase B [Lachnospiraceae bacterium]|nr:asparagine synthetase B [Lachnospiraceae bacterium]
MYRVTAYRGHIRNHKALCRELGVDSALSRKEKEEAILVASYRKWGTQCGLYLHGSFACVLTEAETDTTVLLRDPFGTKTLYYYLTGDGQLLCGTHISDITSREGFEKKLNERMLQLYLSLTYPGGEETFFEGIKKVMPGHIAIFAQGELTVERYWKPEYRPDDSRTTSDFADELHETLRVIVRELEEDGAPAGSFLSGGVDSAYVLSMSGAARAYGVGYDDERLDESRLAEATADILGRKFIRRVVKPEEYFAIVPFVVRHMEQPLGDASAIAFALGARAASEDLDRENVTDKVIYSGEGSDEFFGGYHIYANAEKYGDRLRQSYAGNTNIMKEEEKRDLLRQYIRGVTPAQLTAPLYDETEGCDPLTRMCDVDIRLWLEGDIYLNVDRMSHAAGIEVRMPLTDVRIFDIASRIPSSLKVKDGVSKPVIRAAAAKNLPEEAAYRKKLGFVVPIRYWLADERHNADVRALLHSDLSSRFFRQNDLDRMLDAYLGGYSDLWRRVWAVYIFLVWMRENF